MPKNMMKNSKNDYRKGTNYPRLEKEYGAARSTIVGLVKKYSGECKYSSKSQVNDPYAKEIHNLNKKLRN